jgi:ATP-dependent DNA helicase RecG
MACKAAIRIFHYTGTRIEHRPVPNLIKNPKTISGPLIRQNEDAYEYVLNEIVGGLRLAASGFETVQSLSDPRHQGSYYQCGYSP